MIGAAERKAAERRRRRDAGFVLVQEWVHRTCSADLKRHAAKLRRLHQLAAGSGGALVQDGGLFMLHERQPRVNKLTS